VRRSCRLTEYALKHGAARVHLAGRLGERSARRIPTRLQLCPRSRGAAAERRQKEKKGEGRGGLKKNWAKVRKRLGQKRVGREEGGDLSKKR